MARRLVIIFFVINFKMCLKTLQGPIDTITGDLLWRGVERDKVAFFETRLAESLSS